MTRRTCLTAAAAVTALIATASATYAQGAGLAQTTTRDVNLNAYVELLRSDLRTQKVAVITTVMQFTEAEDAKFWPVYRQYELALAKINDERMALVTDYADHYDALTDESADRLARKALDLEGKRHELTLATYDRLKAVVSPKTAARFLQVEHQILLLLDLQIASALPIASK